MDDYDSIRDTLCSLLRNFGIETTEAANGVEALAILKDKKFDAIFTDLVMPEMDGFELCEEIRQNKDLRDIPIVVTSTHCDTNYIIKALRYGAADYIPKPVGAQTVKVVLNRVLSPINTGLSNE